ncbi:MAG: hypothetical protein JG762_504 [Deferribacteraceae bacterium]|jgi:histidinol phosphatase-like PHP family hydrolase|nr:hypothetical protein [Deferribacteraceae bacterium]
MKNLKFYDLHTHTTFSDGVLIPAESARRAEVIGYSGIAITDHADDSNFKFIIEKQKEFQKSFNKVSDFKVIIGVEFTHVKPVLLEKIIPEARKFGADIVVVHGETIVEPVKEGTNRAAIEACADILAHPGLITEDEVKLAAENGVALEITTRKGHSYTNGHVYNLAKRFGANLVLNNDFHSPGDNLSIEMLVKVLKGIGINDEEIVTIFGNNEKIFNKGLGGLK